MLIIKKKEEVYLRTVGSLQLPSSVKYNPTKIVGPLLNYFISKVKLKKERLDPNEGGGKKHA